MTGPWRGGAVLDTCAAQHEPRLYGWVHHVTTFTPEGRVASIEIDHDDVQAPRYVECVSAAIRQARLPAVDVSVRVRFPIELLRRR